MPLFSVGFKRWYELRPIGTVLTRDRENTFQPVPIFPIKSLAHFVTALMLGLPW
jgi:hypothetical protein